MTSPAPPTGPVSEPQSADASGNLNNRYLRGLAGRPGRFFAMCLALTFLNFAVWSVATPLFASPDEPAHVVYAAAAVRGEIVGGTIDSASNAMTRVFVPEVFAAGYPYTTCFRGHDTVPASCAPALQTSTRIVETATYVGRYPPLYYLIVGLPSLATESELAIYLMRLMGALLDSILISLALLSVAVWSRSRLLLVGTIAAATPTVWFFGSVVNPSGLEICAAICLWTSGLVLALEHPDHPPVGLVAIVVATTAVLLLARPLSPLWALIIVAVLALLGGRAAMVGILRSRFMRWSIAPLAACGLFTTVWVVWQHSLDLLPAGAPVPAHETRLHLVASIFGETGAWIQQMIGVFGWLDTYPPLVTYLVWLGVTGLVIGLAVSSSKGRRVGALFLLGLAVLLIPVAIAYSQSHRLGIVWQGRDILPLAVGLPLSAVALLEQSEIVRPWRVRVSDVLCVAMGIGDVAAFIEALRRYTVGVAGPLNFLSGPWQPPLGSLSVSVCCCLFVTLLIGLVTQEVRYGTAFAGAYLRPLRPSSSIWREITRGDLRSLRRDARRAFADGGAQAPDAPAER